MLYHFFWLLRHYIPSFFFCIRYLPLRQAVRVPILLGSGVKVGALRRGDIILEQPRRSAVILGFNGTLGRCTKQTLLDVRNGGKIIFRGSAIITRGTSLVCSKGVIDIGDGFFCNGNCWLFSDKAIIFGSDCMLGWDISINTTDGHYMVYNGVRQQSMSAPISIGKHVWLCSAVTIGKGVIVGDNSVVAQRALVTKSFPFGHQLVGGMPAKVIRENVGWNAK